MLLDDKGLASAMFVCNPNFQDKLLLVGLWIVINRI